MDLALHARLKNSPRFKNSSRAACSSIQRGWKLETWDSQAGSVGRKEQKAPPSPSTIGMIPTAPNAPPGNLQCCCHSHHGEILAHINGP